MKQKEIEATAIYLRLFIVGLAFNFDATFHELEEIAKRAFGASFLLLRGLWKVSG